MSEFGVGTSNAKGLALEYGLAQAKLAVSMAKRAPGNIESRPGLAVSFLRDGTAEREVHKRERARRSSAESAEQRWRISQMFLLRTTLGSKHGKARWPNGVAVLKDVREMWSTDEAIVLANVLSPQDYREIEQRPMDIAQKLRDAAARRIVAANTPAEGRPSLRAAKMSGASS
ncbi:MAG: hypothetical protein HND58_04295 [Planctomycetota bacterium]|nr:MAG: hypothetical protein HND58_04295 [Planctomycetota bacterium]